MLAGIGCGDPEPGERLDQLTLPAPRDGLELIEDAASALRAARIAVSDLGLRRPTLDDVFLQLTGAPPNEDGAGPQASTTAGRGPATTSAATAPAPHTRWFLPLHRPSLAELRAAITDASVVTGRNLRHFIRQPQLLVFSTVQPIMFVLLFAYGSAARCAARCTESSTSTSYCPASSCSRWHSAPRRQRSASPKTWNAG